MFYATMGTFADAAEESIHAAIEGKFSKYAPKKLSTEAPDGDGNAELVALKKTIASLERRLKKAETV
jgi:hypothetical protein